MTRILSRGTRAKRGPSHAEKLAFVAKHERISDPTNERSIARKYNQLKRIPWHLEHKASKSQRDTLKEKGFYVTKRGVIVDGPRNTKREKIPGAKMTIQKDGTIKWQVKERSDYIIGLTKREKKEFAKDPNALVKKKLDELKATNPNLRKRKKIQTRLQWGAYQATRDFAPTQFERVNTSSYKVIDAIRRGKDKTQSDKLVGIHFTIHIPRKKGK